MWGDGIWDLSLFSMESPEYIDDLSDTTSLGPHACSIFRALILLGIGMKIGNVTFSGRGSQYIQAECHWAQRKHLNMHSSSVYFDRE